MLNSENGGGEAGMACNSNSGSSNFAQQAITQLNFCLTEKAAYLQPAYYYFAFLRGTFWHLSASCHLKPLSGGECLSLKGNDLGLDKMEIFQNE